MAGGTELVAAPSDPSRRSADRRAAHRRHVRETGQPGAADLHGARVARDRCRRANRCSKKSRPVSRDDATHRRSEGRRRATRAQPHADQREPVPVQRRGVESAPHSLRRDRTRRTSNAIRRSSSTDRCRVTGWRSASRTGSLTTARWCASATATAGRHISERRCVSGGRITRDRRATTPRHRRTVRAQRGRRRHVAGRCHRGTEGVEEASAGRDRMRLAVDVAFVHFAGPRGELELNAVGILEVDRTDERRSA